MSRASGPKRMGAIALGMLLSASLALPFAPVALAEEGTLGDEATELAQDANAPLEENAPAVAPTAEEENAAGENAAGEEATTPTEELEEAVEPTEEAAADEVTQEPAANVEAIEEAAEADVEAAAIEEADGDGGAAIAEDKDDKAEVQTEATKRHIGTATCKASISVQAWTGKQLKPKPTVKWGSTTLKAGTHFKIVAYGTNKNNGTTGNWVKIQGIGSYTGTRVVTFRIKKPSVRYYVHRQTFGWEAAYSKKDGQSSGTTGLAKRLEGICIKLTNTPVSGSIQYCTHVQTYGWRGWKTNGGMSGTTGQAKRLEAIRIRLTGNMAKKYDVWYRVHAQTYGWMGWAKNGERSGTEGLAKRLEAIQIKLLPKGSKVPGSTAFAFRSSKDLTQSYVGTYKKLWVAPRTMYAVEKGNPLAQETLTVRYVAGNRIIFRYRYWNAQRLVVGHQTDWITTVIINGKGSFRYSTNSSSAGQEYGTGTISIDGGRVNLKFKTTSKSRYLSMPLNGANTTFTKKGTVRMN